MKEKGKSSGICAYCGQTKPVTFDHVPPKNLFPKPRPSNLITVPICNECNRGTSLDDEYFRLVVSMEIRAAQHPAAQRVLPSVYRSMERPEARGLKITLLNRIRDVNLISPLGLYVGKARAYKVDYPRLERVAERIVRGLFFHHRGKPVPSTCGIKAWCLAGRAVPEGIRQVVGGIQGSKSYEIGKRTFRYKFSFVEKPGEHPNSSGWLLSIYETIDFLVLIVDEGA